MGWLMCLCLLIFLLHSQVNCSSSFSSSSSSTKLCPHDQSFALLEFKNIFSFNNSTASSCWDKFYPHSYPKMLSWEDGTNCCSWDGVTCDRVTGHVIGLDLSCSQLHGTIHSNSSLFLLPHLQQLNLAFNNFNRSRISSQFGRFASLTSLNLSNSKFLGHIPSEISHLSKLVSLDLSWNYDCKLETLSLKRLVQNLTELREIFLNGVDMSLVEPSSLRNLSSSLTSLNLEFCGFRGNFPNDIFRLPNLQTLDLSKNHYLTGYFLKVNWSSPLKMLDLYDTSFSGEVPNSIGNLQSLNYLNLSSCNFSGSIPASLGNLTQITRLDLSSNHFIGEIPSSLSNLGQLTYLTLSSNNLSGIVELDKFLKFKNLQTLDLSDNSLSLSTINTINSTLPKLSNLRLSSCNLSEFPNFLRTQEELRELDLSNNKIQGEIPNWMWDMGKDSMYYLDLSSNFLTSVVQIPWKNLRYLDLHSNLLQGPLPIPPLSTSVFLVSNNKLTGKIPSLICNVSSLRILNLSNNSFSGIIPKCLGNFSNNLSVLDLRMNAFHGTIPRTFAKGNILRNIDLNDNQLEGSVPRSLINCRNLEVLDLGNNKIEDKFPYWLETLPELQVLVLRSNRFHGPINGSEAKHSFPKLRIFDLSHNDFSGPLPTRYIKNLKAMMNVYEDKTKPKYMGESYYQDSVKLTIKGWEIELVKILTIFTIIDFSNNRFQGEIPKSIGKLSSLLVLNFSHNHLIGYIPSSLENLRMLESLDLSSNNLIGEIPVQLTSIIFLALLNLSQNHLVGPIPRGKQFDTFQNDSYSGNWGLCGVPLSKKCSDDEVPQPPPLIFREEDDLESPSGLEWKVGLMGYGCGMVLGLVMGYLIFLTGNPKWLVRIIEGKHHKR